MPIAPGPDAEPAPGGSRCPNCGAPGLRAYCPECGQAAPGPADYSLRAWAADLASQVTNTDGKLARTLGALVARPGALTVDHLHGRRARYVRPLQLFLLVNVLLFVAAPRVPLFSYSLEKYLRYAPPSPALVGSLVERATPHGHTHDSAAGGAEFEAYRSRFDARVDAQRKSLIILFAPAVAVLLRLIFARRRPAPGVPARYGEHLVFALHVLAFAWLVLAVVGGLGTIAGRMFGAGGPAQIAAAAVTVLLLLLIPLYVLVAVRRAYALSWPRAFAATTVVAAAFLVLLLAYRGLLFFTTYYTL